MAITLCQKVFNGRSGGEDSKFVRKYTEVYQVVTSAGSSSDSAYSILNGARSFGTTPVPPLYASHPHDANAKAKDFRVQQIGTTEWTVTVEYDTQQDEAGGSSSGSKGNKPNPLNRQPRDSWSFAQFQEDVERDVDDEEIATANGEFIAGITRDASNLVLQYQRNEASFNVATALEYQDTVNKSTFLGAPPRCAKVQAITAQKQFEDNVRFYEVTYEIHFRRQGWDKKILHQGRKFKRSYVKATPITGPEVVKLTEEGVIIKPGDTKLPFYKTFKVYEERDFNRLNITIA